MTQAYAGGNGFIKRLLAYPRGPRASKESETVIETPEPLICGMA